MRPTFLHCRMVSWWRTGFPFGSIQGRCLRPIHWRALVSPFAQCKLAPKGNRMPLSGVRCSLRTFFADRDTKGRNSIVQFGMTETALLVIPATISAAMAYVLMVKFHKFSKKVESRERQMDSSPVSLPDRVEDLDKMEFRPVVIEGSFDHTREILLTNRPFVTRSEQDSVDGAGTAKLFQLKKLCAFATDKMGVQIVTPFRCLDTGKWILVNRGWVPLDKQTPEKRKSGQVQGLVKIIGIVRKSETPPKDVTNDPTTNSWVWRDVEAMACHCKCEPYMLDLTSKCNVPGGPIGGQTLTDEDSEKPLLFAVWFVVAVALAVLYLMLPSTWKKSQAFKQQTVAKELRQRGVPERRPQHR